MAVRLYNEYIKVDPNFIPYLAGIVIESIPTNGSRFIPTPASRTFSKMLLRHWKRAMKQKIKAFG